MIDASRLPLPQSDPKVTTTNGGNGALPEDYDPSGFRIERKQTSQCKTPSVSLPSALSAARY